jgi:SIR2-like domain
MLTGEVTPEKGKRKLVVILGAGSSMPLGMPSVKCLDRLMRMKWGPEWAESLRTGDHFRELWCSARTYYRRGPTGPCPALNFEKVLGDMIAMAHWMEPPPWGDTLRQSACCGTPPPHMRFRYHQEGEVEVAAVAGVPLLPEGLVCGESDMPGGECEVAGESSAEVDPRPEVEPTPDHAEGDWRGKFGAHIELTAEYRFLLGRLAQHMRAESQKFNLAKTSEKYKYRKLLEGLGERFDIGIYNLNYDTAALAALPGAYTGFDETGTFEPTRVHDRKDWDFVYHLHGSVHHSFKGQGGNEIFWRKNLIRDQFYDGDGPEAQSLTDRRSRDLMLPRTTLVAGGFKLDQLLVEPFHSFHASLVRHVYAADAILIGGYGFADAHINFALHNRLSHSQDRPPVMVLDKPGPESVEDRANRNDPWAVQLKRALRAGVFKQSSDASLPRDGFEEASCCRVAVWQGGFVEAESQLSHIIRWLGVNN